MKGSFLFFLPNYHSPLSTERMNKWKRIMQDQPLVAQRIIYIGIAKGGSLKVDITKKTPL